MSEVEVVNDFVDDAFRRHYDEIYRYARRRTRDHHDAEDLAQQVFADAAAGLHPDGRSPAAWLYAVARRRFADAARRAASRPARPRLAPHADDYAAVRESLNAALARLPESQREVVVLKLVRGVAFGEIAQLLGTTEEAARMRFHRALRALRANLEQEGVEP